MTSVAVLGPGAVGGVLAVRLARSGVRVICVARPDTAQAIRSEGLSLRHGSETVIERPEAVEQLDEPVDLLLVTVKAPALREALDRVDGGPTLPLMNGLEHVDAIREQLGSEVTVGSVARLEAYRESPTSIVQTTPSALLTVSTSAAADLLESAGFEVEVEPDERRILWDKVARLAPLAVATSLAQRPVGELRVDPDWRAMLEVAVGEACAVAAAEHVNLTPEAQWEIIDAMPADLTTSTARDVAAGRPSELDAITGAVVRAGQRVGIATPTLERLLQEVEGQCQARSR